MSAKQDFPAFFYIFIFFTSLSSISTADQVAIVSATATEPAAVAANAEADAPEAANAEADAPEAVIAASTENSTEKVAPSKRPAEASPDQLARTAFERGDLLYVQGRYREALSYFQRSYRLSGHVALLYNIGNCFERLQAYESASVALASYIPHAPSSTQTILQARLDSLELRALELAQENSTRVNELRVMALRDKQVKRVPVRAAVGYSVLAFGALSAGTGVLFAIGSSKNRKKLNDICVSDEQGTYCPASAEPLLKKQKHFTIAADIALGLAGAAFLSGSYLIFSSRKLEKTLSARIQPTSISLEAVF